MLDFYGQSGSGLVNLHPVAPTKVGLNAAAIDRRKICPTAQATGVASA
jgi:hypothetical protein